MVDLFKAFGIFVLLMVFTVVSAAVLGSMFFGETGNVALIRVEGEITSDSSIFSTGASAEEVVSALEEAEANPDVQAVVVAINSPGGTVVASKEITNTLKSLTKPTVCWLREVAASGAYWVASGCDKIVADEFTITG